MRDFAIGFGLSLWTRGAALFGGGDITDSALLLEGGSDSMLLEGDMTDGDDVLLLEGFG